MKNKIFFLVFVFFSTWSISSQERECGMEAHMAEMMKDPDFAREWELNQNKFKNAVKRSLDTEFRQALMDPVVIPVAVHFPDGLESDRACLEALAQNQIDILNGDFTATNPDANLWPTASDFYPGVNHGVANIQFCIATAFHPEDTDEDLVEGGPAVTIGYDFGGGNDADSNWSGYMNFLVKDIGAGLLGYSPLGGSINAGQSVVINLGAFGSGAGCPDSGIVPGAPYNLGRTVTHELGHFYQLQHPFSGSCDTDDGIADTPNIVDANYGCPDPGSIAGCEVGEFALTMSYMDYGNDDCLYMFSEGQTDVVDTYVTGVLQAQFKPGTVPVCVEVPQYIMSNDTVTTCNGIFYDSGGADDGPTGNYSNNEVFTFTICPENEGQSTQLNFTEFATQNNADIMSIYNASDASDPATLVGEYSGTNGPTDPVIASLTNPTGCLTIVFTSTGAITDFGWLAFISCVDPPAECQTIISQLDTASPVVDAEGVILVCPGEEITLTGSGQFSEPGGGVGAAYIWDIGDGTSISGQTVTFSFDEPGVYIANLNIWDTNTSVFPEGCRNDNRINQYIQVSTTPTFEASEDTVNPICYGDTSIITPLVTPTPYINECTVPESIVTFLPDGNGTSYQTCIVVDCFEEGQTLELITQLQDICLNIEHSYLGDLDIIIESPNGQQAFLHQYPSGFGTYLGSPLDNTGSGTDPGVGADYCFSMDGATDLVDGPTIQAGDPLSNSIEPGTYSPVESFNQLIGSPLNGNWCITVTDNLSIDNGYLFNWTLNFDTSIVPTSLSFTPEIISGYWEGDEPTIDEVNGDILTVTPDSDGQFCYTYTVLDNFGCEYSDEICIEVLPELVHDLPTDLFICDPVSSDAIFNLSPNEATVLAPNANPENFVVTFHNSEEDAENDDTPIPNPSSYVGLDEEVIFLRFEYLDSNCFEIETFQLLLLDAPEVFPTDDLVLCDDISNDEVEAFDLEQQTVDVLGTQSVSDFTVTYHTNGDDADLGVNSISSPYNNISNPQPIYIRIQSLIGAGCYVATKDPVFNLIVTNQAEAIAPDDLTLCDATSSGNLEAVFDLNQQTTIILGSQDPTTFAVTYHSSQDDADLGNFPLTSPLSTTAQTIYVRVEEAGVPNCYGSTEFNLIVNPLPSTIEMTPLAICADDTDGFASFILTDKDVEALNVNDSTEVIVSYHVSELDADSGDNALPSPYTNTTQDAQTIYIRLENTNTLCFSTMPLNLAVNPLPVPITPPLQTVCDDDFDGFASFDFTGIDSIVLGEQTGMDVSYHVSELDADSGGNALPITYMNTEVNTQTIFIRLEIVSTGCYATTTLDLEVLPLPVVPTITDYVLCDNTDSGDLQEIFDLSINDSDIIGIQNSSVAYYESQADADAGINALVNVYENTSSPQTIYVSLTDLETGCISTGSFTLIVNPLPSLVLPTPLEVCDDGTPDGLTELNLSIKDDEIRGGNPDYSISYYLTQSDADLGVTPLSIPYTNISNPQTVFVRGENVNTGCVATTTLELGVIQAAVANAPPPMEFCDPDNDGYGEFVLTDSDDLITGSAAGVTVTYHETLSDANTGANPLASPYNNVVIDTQTIYARVESATVVTDCATIIDLVLNVYPTPQLLTPTALELCDDNLDQVVQFDLSDSVTELLNGIELSDVVISFYETEANASSSNNAISTPLAYSNISNPQTVWVRVEYPVTGCEKLTSLELIVNPLPVIVQPTPLALCDDAVADSFTSFDLTLKNTEITVGDGSLEVVYYTTFVDAESATNAIADPTAYTNQAIGTAAPNPQTLHVRVTDLDTGCYDLTTLTIRVLPNPTPSPDPMDLELCDDTNSGDGFEVFDLTTEEIFILNGELGVSATYHETLEDAQAGEDAITDPETYTNIETPAQTIHVRVTNDLTGCYTLVDFDIIVLPLPNATAVADMIACELNTDDVFDFDLNTQSSLILAGQDPSIFEVTYHTSLADAQDGMNFLGSPYTNSSDPEIIYVSVFNTDTECRNTQLQFTLEVHEAAQASAPLEVYVLCDDNVETDGDPTNDRVQFDLSTQDLLVLNGQDPLNYTVSYYPSQADADQGINALPTLYENGINPQVIIARVDNDLQVLDATGSLVDSSICYETALVTLEVNPLPIVDIDTDYILCVDTNGTEVLAPLEVDTGLSSVDYTFIWSDATGAVVGTGSSYAPLQGGNYTLEVFDATLSTQCAAPVEVFTVIESTPPLLTAQVRTAAFASTHVIEAVTGQGIYEYSLDQGPWGDSGMFIDVTPGQHVVTARDLNGCGEAQVVVYVIDYPLYLTPNGDGYNDTWNIVGIANQANAKIYIFDRYGKLLKQISPSGTGWDGTYNGAQLPSSDYWFTLEYLDPTTGTPEILRAHFSLKR